MLPCSSSKEVRRNKVKIYKTRKEHHMQNIHVHANIKILKSALMIVSCIFSFYTICNEYERAYVLNIIFHNNFITTMYLMARMVLGGVKTISCFVYHLSQHIQYKPLKMYWFMDCFPDWYGCRWINIRLIKSVFIFWPCYVK